MSKVSVLRQENWQSRLIPGRAGSQADAIHRKGVARWHADFREIAELKSEQGQDRAGWNALQLVTTLILPKVATRDQERTLPFWVGTDIV
jgi:hypothetical protein